MPQGDGAGEDTWVIIGQVVGAFGIRGDLKVRPLTDFPERFASTATVYVGAKHVAYDVSSAHLHKQQVILHLKGVDDVTAAERLRNRGIFIPESDLTSLPSDQFYIHDVIGLRVEHVDGRFLGTIQDVFSAGANDVYIVRDAATGQEQFLPAVKAFIKDIDIARGVVRVEPIPGLFDEDAEDAR